MCEISSVPTTNTCAQLSKDLEKAVLQDEGNLYRMRRAFFYSPTAAPVLLKVVYNVSFSDNITEMVSCCGDTSCCGMNSLPNLTAELVQGNIIYG